MNSGFVAQCKVASQGHECTVNDLEVMFSNPCRVECVVHGTSVQFVLENKYLCIKASMGPLFFSKHTCKLIGAQ